MRCSHMLQVYCILSIYQSQIYPPTNWSIRDHIHSNWLTDSLLLADIGKPHPEEKRKRFMVCERSVGGGFGASFRELTMSVDFLIYSFNTV